MVKYSLRSAEHRQGGDWGGGRRAGGDLAHVYAGKGRTVQPFQNPREQPVISRGWGQNLQASSYPQAQETGCLSSGGAGWGKGRRQKLSAGPPGSCVLQLCGLPVGRHAWDPGSFQLGARTQIPPNSEPGTKAAVWPSRRPDREAVGSPGVLKCGIVLGQPNKTELGCDSETPEFRNPTSARSLCLQSHPRPG